MGKWGEIGLLRNFNDCFPLDVDEIPPVRAKGDTTCALLSNMGETCGKLITKMPRNLDT